MMPAFAAIVKDLDAHRPHLPLAYWTEADRRRDDRLLEAINWCVVVDTLLCDAATRATRSAHRAWCADRKARQRAERAVPRPPRPERDPYGDALRPGWVRVTNTSGAFVRERRIDFDTLQEMPPGARPEPREATVPRHALAFPRLEAPAPRVGAAAWDALAPLPGWERTPDAREAAFALEAAAVEAAVEEEQANAPLPAATDLVVNHRELRGKQRFVDDDTVSLHAPDEGCAYCGRGPALCTCAFGDEPGDEGDYDGFGDDRAEALIALEGDILACDLDYSATMGAFRQAEPTLAYLERFRMPKDSDEEAMRRRQIALVAAVPERTGRRIDELEAKRELASWHLIGLHLAEAKIGADDRKFDPDDSAKDKAIRLALGYEHGDLDAMLLDFAEQIVEERREGGTARAARLARLRAILAERDRVRPAEIERVRAGNALLALAAQEIGLAAD